MRCKKVPLAASKAASAAAPGKVTRGRTAACGSKSSSSDEEEDEDDSSSEEDSSGSSDDATSSEKEGEEEKVTPAPLDAAGRPGPSPQAVIASVVERMTTTIPVEYDRLPVAHGKVEVGDVLAYKLLEIGLDMCPRISDWRQSCAVAVDTVTGSVVLEPHPDPRVHPLHAELDVLRARLAAEAAGEADATAAEAADVCAVELDWEALPFPTEYDPAGLLRVTLDRLADVRIVHAANNAGTPAPAVARVSAPVPTPVAHSCVAADGKPVSTPPMGTGAAAVRCFGANHQAAGGQGGAPVAKTPMRQAPGLPRGTLSRPAAPRPGLGTPSTSAKRPPPPPPQQQQQLPSRPGTPAAKTSTVGATIVLARPRAQVASTEAVVAAATASKTGSIVPAVGGWAVIADELRQKRLELGMGTSTPPVSHVPDSSKPSREQQRKQQQQQGRLEQAKSQPSAQPHRLSGLPRPGGGGASSGAGPCGTAPPSIPEVTIPGFRSRAGAQPDGNSAGRSSTGGPGNEGTIGVAQAEVELGGEGAHRTEGGSGSANASGRGEGAAGVEIPGAAKPRGGARRIAMGPMLSYLRNSGGL
ncbi:hypothetical protein Vafri_16698 [Volvox africanus]|uniref:Coilin tudor domain-containing protein n=1 Tax=Volvox africanus TaxID=51714 RepID=A0A8J4F5Y4_9CHLO|nr:hypothetical protein Vafri_16698 [Volvox africanus]